MAVLTPDDLFTIAIDEAWRTRPILSSDQESVLSSLHGTTSMTLFQDRRERTRRDATVLLDEKQSQIRVLQPNMAKISSANITAPR
ncbi:hypothetical protein OK016_27515 [Vibrio chagasii]|nr:hypothetical protein [Vibrio chagasii]